jgi:uncharacterized FlaG/YvyC family protein
MDPMSENTIFSSGWQAQNNASHIASQERESRVVEPRKQPAESSRQQADPVNYGKSIALTKVQFTIDSETKDVIIYIRDQESDRVLRTIPADAIKDLPPGQLLNVYG